MIYEIHMIKSFPPSNLNSGEDRAPKTSQYGGYLRSNISSFCVKKTLKGGGSLDRLKKSLSVERGNFSRQMPSEVAKLFAAEGYPQEICDAVAVLTAKIGKKDDDPAQKAKGKEDARVQSKQMIFFGDSDVRAIADAVKECIAINMHPEISAKESANENSAAEKKRPTKKQLREAKGARQTKLDAALSCMLEEITAMDDESIENLAGAIKGIEAKKVEACVKDTDTRPIPLEVALFGRMTTSDCIRDVEAAVQVGLTMSTNEVVPETMVVAAVDDLLTSGKLSDKGAGNLTTLDFNASCYYFYTSLDTDVLRENLRYNDNADEILPLAVEAFIRDMAKENPKAHQSNLAAPVMPAAMLIECKDIKSPMTLATAFETPVNPINPALGSIKRLVREIDEASREFSLEAESRLWFVRGKYSDGTSECVPACATATFDTFEQLVKAASAALH